MLKDPKSRKPRRSVPLPAVAVEALKAHRERQGVVPIDGLVFSRAADRNLTPRKSERSQAGSGPVHSTTDWQGLLASVGLP